jgi:hypothetical protein
MQHGKMTLHEHMFISVIHLKVPSGIDKRSALHTSYEKFLNSLFFCLSSIKVFFVFIYCKYKCTVYRAVRAFETQRLEPSVALWTISIKSLFWAQQPPVGQGFLIHEVSGSHTTTRHSR